MKKVFGYFLVSVPFIGIIFMIYKAGGLEPLLFALGVTGTIVGFVFAGVYLVMR